MRRLQPAAYHKCHRQSSTTFSQQNVFKKYFQNYLQYCNEGGAKAAAATGFVLWGLGDITTQYLEKRIARSRGKKEEPFDFKRLWATIFYGTLVAGALGHYWYELIHVIAASKLKLRDGSAALIATKLALECAIWHPLGLSVFWVLQGVWAEGKTVGSVAKELRTDLLPALAVEMSLWTPIDILNFKFTPVQLQVIVVNFVSFFEAILLSYLHSDVLVHPPPTTN
eukprot:GILI01034168.1.p1 GENE.GILI01034168.1~~GILI01034168.1.p1  ORF type:complete len:225 (+),score=31.22 GILI01034168.1:134-808(+)